MYLYFDKTGTLKEIINDEALRQGNSGVNKIYLYVEDQTYTSVDVTYLLKSNLIVGPENYNTFATGNAKQIPFNPKRDLKYFQYYKDYNFLVIDLEADVNGNSPLDEAGVVHCNMTIMPLGLVLGEVNFYVEVNATLDQHYVASQEYLSLADYTFLRKFINDFTTTAPTITKTTQTLSPGSNADVQVTSAASNGTWSLDFLFKIPQGATGETGPQGPDGVTPHIDSITGNWFVGSTNTGVHAQGPQGDSGIRSYDLGNNFASPNAFLSAIFARDNLQDLDRFTGSSLYPPDATGTWSVEIIATVSLENDYYPVIHFTYEIFDHAADKVGSPANGIAYQDARGTLKIEYFIYTSEVEDFLSSMQGEIEAKQDQLTTTSVSDGTINKSIGFDSNNNLVKGTAGKTYYRHIISFYASAAGSAPSQGGNLELINESATALDAETFIATVYNLGYVSDYYCVLVTSMSNSTCSVYSSNGTSLVCVYKTSVSAGSIRTINASDISSFHDKVVTL